MSDDPVRLLDDPTAPAALRGDLGRASNASALSFDEGAGLARLAAAIGVLPPPGGGGASGTPSPAAAGGAGAGSGAAGAGSVFGSGTFWGFIAAGVVCGGVILAVPPSTPEPPRSAVASAPLRPAPVATTTPAARPEGAHAAESPGLAGTAEPVKPPARAPGRAAHAALGAGGGKGTTTAGEAEPSAARGSNDLAAEVEDLAALRTTARSDPARAVELAAAGQRRFANGVFGEEREAIAIGALGRSGRSDEAKRRAKAFLAGRPNSVFAEDVRRVLAP